MVLYCILIFTPLSFFNQVQFLLWYSRYFIGSSYLLYENYPLFNFILYTNLQLVVLFFSPSVERFIHEPLARETGRPLPTSSAINEVSYLYPMILLSPGFIHIFEQKIQGLSRTHFPFFKDSIQCKKEPWVYVFFSSSTTWVRSEGPFVFAPFSLEFYLNYKVSIAIQGVSSTDCNFLGLWRPWKASRGFSKFVSERFLCKRSEDTCRRIGLNTPKLR